jgi:Mce-associated membrane protein
LLTAAALTGWLYFVQYRADQQVNPAAQQVALKAAQDGTVAVLSYSPDTLDKDLDNAKSHLTGEFLKYYDDFTNQVVRPAVQQKSVQTEAKVIRSAVSEMQPDKAVVLLFVNQQTTG